MDFLCSLKYAPISFFTLYHLSSKDGVVIHIEFFDYLLNFMRIIAYVKFVHFVVWSTPIKTKSLKRKKNEKRQEQIA